MFIYAISLFSPTHQTLALHPQTKVEMSGSPQQSSPSPLIKQFTIAFEGNALGYVLYGEFGLLPASSPL